LETGLRVEAVRGLRPHLSFGNKIACGGRERDGASFVLWKQHSVCQSGGREGHGSSFVLWKCIPPGCREETQGPWACFVLWKQDCVWRPRGAVRPVLSIATIIAPGGREGSRPLQAHASAGMMAGSDPKISRRRLRVKPAGFCEKMLIPCAWYQKCWA
jgi:hypothetical protein